MTSSSDSPFPRFPTGTDPVAACDAFTKAWEFATVPPRIAEYLPDGLLLRRSVLLELIRIDLRRRWLHTTVGRPGEVLPKRLYEYCSEFQELTAPDLPAELVYEEFVIRRHHGVRVDPAECLREYPDQATELRELLTLDDEDQSTRWPVGDEFTEQSGQSTRIPDETTLAPHRESRLSAGSLDSIEMLDQFEIGQRVDDFDLLTSLGRGAFARVFLARQRSMQRLVAVKVSADRGTEPQTLAQLDHDYIVRVFDQRLLQNMRAGANRRLRLLYMQFLPGGTLLGLLRWVRATPISERSGKLLLDAVDSAMEEKGEIRPTDSSTRSEIAELTWSETVAWLGVRIAEALCYADGHGVLHRDVKPANVLLTAEGVPKLADFNISFSRDLGDGSPVAYFGGSLSYMSPEQLEACHPGLERTAADLDTRSDLFSLGVVLWELLTGAKPFDDDTAGDTGDATTLAAMLERRRCGVDEIAQARVPADCPAALRRVLLTCLEPDRDQRWADGAALSRQLALCLDPRARDLVDPPRNSFRRRLRRWFIPLVMLAIGVPNALASMYNISYNRMLIIDKLSDHPRHQFEATVTLVNAILFPLGAVILIYMCRYLLYVPWGLEHGRTYDESVLVRTRKDVLRVGERAVLVAFSSWLISGITFPIVLQITAGNITPKSYLHLIASHAVCGAIAASYPFFLVTLLMVRCIYPIFLSRGDVSGADASWLRELGRRCSWYLAIAASVPLIAVVGITFIPIDDIVQVVVPVRILCAGSVIAFVVTYAVFRALENDLRALERVVSPGR